MGLRRSESIFNVEQTNRNTKTRTEIADKTSAIPVAITPFASLAYAVEARARKESGNEKAHHATLKLFNDFLNKTGLLACFHITKSSILARLQKHYIKYKFYVTKIAN